MRFNSKFLCGLFLLFSLYSSVFCQTSGASEPATTEVPDEAFLLKVFDVDAKVDALAEGKPVEGVVERGRIEFVAFGVPLREGFGFPDILLTLTVANVGADADLYCLPLEVVRVSKAYPSPGFSSWQSESSQGSDYIFISRNSSSYNLAVRRTVTPNGTEFVSEFACSVVGRTSTPSAFRLEVDVDYGFRTLVADELGAMRSIYDSCCATPGSCTGWVDRSTDVATGEPGKGFVGLDFCHMPGSTCTEDGRLLRLDMDEFGLDCEFPAKQVQQLTSLQKLAMRRNSITGDIWEIAALLKTLPVLDELSLRENLITGKLSKNGPASESNTICGLVKGGLEFLDLQANDIEGPLPHCLFDARSKLHVLVMDGNPLTGPLPDVFTNSSPMEFLSIGRANLTGTVPGSLSKAKNLVVLDLDKNELKGTLPKDFGASEHLSAVTLDGNNLEGKIPEPLGKSDSISWLSLANNSFTDFPDSWMRSNGAGQRLGLVGLSGNQLSGSFPFALASSEAIETLDLSNNKLTGPLPNVKGMFAKARYIDLSDNGFTGTVGKDWGKVGVVNNTIITATGVPLLDFSGNKLDGRLPKEFLNVTGLPFTVVLRQAIRIGGNKMDCPEEAADHLGGIEDCVKPLEKIRDLMEEFEISGLEAPAPAPGFELDMFDEEEFVLNELMKIDDN